MRVELNKVAIFLCVLAIGNCAPQKDTSIAPDKKIQQVSYELVTPEQASDIAIPPIIKDTTDTPTTTKAPETTTKASDTTTKAPETTTKAPDTTTKAPETTTKAPDTTTKTPDTTTTKAPDTTTKAPDTTTKAPDTTTKTPDTTTKAPETTTTAPDTTTAAPTPKPEPIPCRRFDGPSFIGGIVLTIGLIAISFVVWKFYKSRTERNYHTL